MFLVVKRNKKSVLVCLLICLGIMIGSTYIWQDQRVKADKSNAMQVTRLMDDIPVHQADFFTEYRLDRDRLRSERAEILREGMRSATDEDNRRSLQEKILKMAQEKKCETEMESLIKAKGFADALIFCSDEAVSAVVKAERLEKEDVIQVADIITRISKAKLENVTISAKP